MFGRIGKCICTALIAIILLIGIIPETSVYAKDVAPDILVLSSYSLSYEEVPEQLDGIIDALSEDIYSVDFEFMDTKRFGDDEDILEFYAYFKYKYEKLGAYDYVISCDDAALQFVMDYRDEFFMDTPVIFIGINDADRCDEARALGMVGFNETPDYAVNLDLIRSFFPERGNLLVIVDGTYTGVGFYKGVLPFIEDNESFDNIEIYNTSDESAPEIRARLNALDDSWSILDLAFFEDADGNAYTVEKGVKMILQCCDAPIFRLSVSPVGYGTIGGVAYSHRNAGYAAGEIVHDFIAGAALSEIDMQYIDVYTPIFDRDVLDKYGITNSLLPSDSVIINEHVSFYKQHMLVINISIVIVLVTIIIVLIIVDLLRKKRQSELDFLTQLPNRKYILKKLIKLRSKRKYFAVFMMDFDGFKGVNDTFGHRFGDALLVDAAIRLKSYKKEGVSVGRIGGDEFLGYIDKADSAEIIRLCENMCEVISEPYISEENELRVTVSIGVAIYPDNATDVEALIAYADTALYNTKRQGKNGYTIYSE